MTISSKQTSSNHSNGTATPNPRHKPISTAHQSSGKQCPKLLPSGFIGQAIACSFAAIFALDAANLTTACGFPVQDANPSAKTTAAITDKPKPWNQWRGPERDTQFSGPQWPKSIDGKNLTTLWQAKQGPSYSGPITDGKYIYSTETLEKKEEVVRALDLKTGEVKWEARWPGAMQVPFFAASNGSWIRSTPACDGKRVFVVGILDTLHCLDAESGKELWMIDFAKEYQTGMPSFGAVCSPMMDEKHLYLQAANSFFKLRKEDGKVVFRTMEENGGMMSGGSFSSPAFAKMQDKQQILVQSRTNLAGVEPETGQVLWQTEVPSFRGMNILTPIEFEDSVFTSSYNNQSYLYQIPASKGGSSNSNNVSTAWSSPAKGYMSTPTVIDGYAYMLLQNGRMGCLELKTGERKWTSPKSFGDYCSFVTQGDKFLVLSNDGVLRLVKASPDDCEIISQYQLPGITDSWAHIGMGVTGDNQIQIYVRSIDAMTVFNWSQN